MTSDSKFLVLFFYTSLALGVLMGLNAIRIVAELLLWPSAPSSWYIAALLPKAGIAIIALSVGLMVRYTLSNPYTYGASDTVIGKWRQW